MKQRWTALTVVCVVITLVLAWMNQAERWDARADASKRVLAVRRAADGAFSRFVEDAAVRLRAWNPGEPTPEPFGAVFHLEPDQPREWLAPFEPDEGVALGFLAHKLVIAAHGPHGLVEGTVPDAALRAALRGDPGVGDPGAILESGPDAECARYTSLAILDEQHEVVYFDTAPSKDVTQQMQEAAGQGLRREKGKLPRGLLSGEPSEAESDGTAPEYGGLRGKRVHGHWDRWSGSKSFWLLVEINQRSAERTISGIRLEYDGVAYGHVHLWHLFVGLTLLSFLITVAMWLRDRNEKLSVIVRVFKYAKPYKGGVVLVFVLGLLETGIGATKVLFAKGIFDYVLAAPPELQHHRLIVLVAGMALLAVAMGLTAYGQKYFAGYYQLLIMADVRQIMGAKLATLPIPYHDRFRSGELLSRFERDSAHMRKVLLLLFKQVAVEPFNLGWAAVYAFVLNPRLAVVLLGLPIIVFPLFRIAKRIKKRATKRQVQRADLSHVLFQMLTGIKVVKAFGGEQRESERLDLVNRKYVETSRKITHLSALAEGMLDFLQMLGAALVFWIGGYLILSDGLTMGELTAFIVVMQRFYSGAKKLTSTANDLVDASAGVERVYEVLDAENEMPDGPGELPVRALVDGVRLEDVSFSYQDRMVLEHFDLNVPAGKVVALVGPTGAGKSTICSLVARFYDPTAGRVTYDGVDLRQVKLSSVVSNLAIVTQDAFLFNESIRDNIRYGRPGATREEIERAAADAFVHDEIMGMDGGYDKLAGERGMAVSGGQRQRITIARALLKNAPVLILDEATSALDSSTEKSIQLALERLMHGRTVIVVAHRLSTILHADRVVVLDQGRILEQGSPAELLEREDGRFKRMYELQMGGIDVLEGGGHEEAQPRFEDVSEFGDVEDEDDA